MAASSSKSAVLLAVIGNFFLTILKFVTFAFSGSGAMFSEGLHSLADTANQFLLFIGIRRSERPADATFHYGFGAERYFYALLSAVGIFILGCGVTLYHGVHSLQHPPELEIGWPIFAVLGISLLVDGFVLAKAFGVARGEMGDKGLIEFLRTSTDPTLGAVLLEDGVACLGVLVALGGILLSDFTGSPYPDIAATFIIGLMMGLIAVWLGFQNRTLILGRAIPETVQAECVAYLREQPTVERVHTVKSRIVGAKRFRFKAEVDWNGAVLAGRFEEWIDAWSERLDTPDERRAFARELGEKVTEALGDEIDRIEAELTRLHPELAFVDLESD